MLRAQRCGQDHPYLDKIFPSPLPVRTGIGCFDSEILIIGFVSVARQRWFRFPGLCFAWYDFSSAVPTQLHRKHWDTVIFHPFSAQKHHIVFVREERKPRTSIIQENLSPEMREEKRKNKQWVLSYLDHTTGCVFFVGGSHVLNA